MGKQITKGIKGFQKGENYRSGKKLSEESINKMKKTITKGFKNGRISWNKNKNLSEEHKRKISLANKGKIRTKETRLKMSEVKKGEKSYLWKGGISSENELIRKNIEFRLWREAVFARDNWTCQKTRVKGGKLHPHHIQNFSDFPELRFAIDNGITLSEETHKEFHKKYGFSNNTKKQLEEFLNDK